MSRLSYFVRHPGRALSGLAVVTAAVGVTIGSGANFNAQAVNASNVFTSGSLSVGDSQSGAILTASNMAPGNSASGLVAIQNTGTITGAFAVAEANVTGATLAAGLTLTINDCGSFTGTAPTTCPTSTQLWSGALNALPSTSLGNWTANQGHLYQFVVTLPATAANTLQGLTTSVDFNWTATA